jgi:predicted PurR-regulated permease PerM
MPDDSIKNLQRSFYFLASLILAFGLLYWAQRVLIPMALAILLAFVLTPAVSSLQRRGLGRLPATFAAVAMALFVLIAIGWLIYQQMDSLAKELTQEDFRKQLANKVGQVFATGSEGVLHDIQAVADEVTKKTQEASHLSSDPQTIQTVRVEQSLFSQVLATAGPAAEFLGTAALVLVLVTFMLIKREDMRNRLVRLLGHGRLIVTTRAFDEAGDRISRYLLMQVLVNALFGIAITAGLALVGIRYAPLWGVICGLLRFIPYLGTWLGAALLGAFAIATSEGWRDPILVFALFLVLEIIAANVLEPLLFGHSTGVSPVALLMAAAFWLFMWGPVGLILSTPMTVCLVVLGKYVPQLEFFDVLLSDEPVLDPEVSYYQRLLAHDQDEAAELIEQHLVQKPVETVFEEVLLPTLVLAKRDAGQGNLSPEDADYILETTRDMLPTIVQQQKSNEKPAEDEIKCDFLKPVLILGCPAADETDELALEMFQQFLPTNCSDFIVLSSHTLAAEVPTKIDELDPALVLIAAIPPGGLAQVRYLCKRLRTRYAKLKILVGRWAATEEAGRVRERLKAAGADNVAFSFAESQAQIVPLIQVASSPSSEISKEEREPALSH